MRKAPAVLREMQLVKTNGFLNEVQREAVLKTLREELDFIIGQQALPLGDTRGKDGVFIASKK